MIKADSSHRSPLICNGELRDSVLTAADDCLIIPISTNQNLLTSPRFAPTNQEQRRQLLQEMCTNDSIAFPGKNRSFDDIPNKELDHLIVDDRHGIIYCYVPKVRSRRDPGRREAPELLTMQACVLPHPR